MKILAFDTTNNSVSASISYGGSILSYREELRPSMQAETIMPMIEDVLKDVGFSYQDMDYIAVTNGPGSFTGIRIGLSVAKGIILGTKAKGVVVSNFELSYLRTYPQIMSCTKMFIFLNAYRGQLYSQIFDRNNGDISLPTLIDYSFAVDMLKKENETIVCAGSGVEFIYNKIKNIKNIIILPRFTRVKALDVCRYVNNKLKANETLNKIIEPLYIRPVDAVL